MTLHFNITPGEFAEFNKSFLKKTFKGSWKLYVSIAVLIIGYNVYSFYDHNMVISEDGIETDSVSYIEPIINWLIMIAIFGALWWYIMKRQWSGGSDKFSLKYFFIAIISLIVVLFVVSASIGIESAMYQYIEPVINWLVMIAILGGLWAYIMKRVKFISNPKENMDKMLDYRDMIISEDKIQLNTKTSETAFKWDGFMKWEQTANLYLIYILSNNAILIPKRAFENEQQQAEFEALLHRKISSNKVDLKSPNVLDA